MRLQAVLLFVFQTYTTRSRAISDARHARAASRSEEGLSFGRPASEDERRLSLDDSARLADTKPSER